MFTYVFYCFLAYLLYNLIFRFIVPLYRTTKQVKRTFRDMQSRMQQKESPYEPVKEKPATSVKSKGEYIDFEEVKE
jgi:hypothetical protein